MWVQKGHSTLKRAFFGGAVLAPLGAAASLALVSAFLRIPPRGLVLPFLVCWMVTIALSPFAYWADRRAVLSADPRFVALGMVWTCPHF
jgi:hypothetical protein